MRVIRAKGLKHADARRFVHDLVIELNNPWSFASLGQGRVSKKCLQSYQFPRLMRSMRRIEEKYMVKQREGLLSSRVLAYVEIHGHEEWFCITVDCADKSVLPATRRLLQEQIYCFDSFSIREDVDDYVSLNIQSN